MPLEPTYTRAEHPVLCCVTLDLTQSLGIKFCSGSSLVSFPGPTGIFCLPKIVTWRSLQGRVRLFSVSICPWLFYATTWLPGCRCGLSSLGWASAWPAQGFQREGLGIHSFIPIVSSHFSFSFSGAYTDFFPLDCRPIQTDVKAGHKLHFFF